MKITKEDFINHNLWKLFPTIEVPFTADIPKDYLGTMGVPITFMDKFTPKQFIIVDSVKPVINGRSKYQRIIIRHTNPPFPKSMDLEKFNSLLEKAGAKYRLEFFVTRIDSENTLL